MAGRTGGARITLKNLVVVSVDGENGEIFLSGPVPGSRGSGLIITKIKAGTLADLAERAQTVTAQVVEGEEGAEEKKEGAEAANEKVEQDKEVKEKQNES